MRNTQSWIVAFLFNIGQVMLVQRMSLWPGVVFVTTWQILGTVVVLKINQGRPPQ